MVAGFASESLAGFNRNSHFRLKILLSLSLSKAPPSAHSGRIKPAMVPKKRNKNLDKWHRFGETAK